MTDADNRPALVGQVERPVRPASEPPEPLLPERTYTIELRGW